MSCTNEGRTGGQGLSGGKKFFVNCSCTFSNPIDDFLVVLNSSYMLCSIAPTSDPNVQSGPTTWF